MRPVKGKLLSFGDVNAHLCDIFRHTLVYMIVYILVTFAYVLSCLVLCVVSSTGTEKPKK